MTDPNLTSPHRLDAGNLHAYVAHPYWHKDPAIRAANVDSAAKLASAVIAAGFVAVAPLQASRGIETDHNEATWLHHGLSLLRRCDVMFLPDGALESSHGCRKEVAEASRLGIPVHFVGGLDGAWVVGPKHLLARELGESRPFAERTESLETTILGEK